MNINFDKNVLPNFFKMGFYHAELIEPMELDDFIKLISNFGDILRTHKHALKGGLVQVISNSELFGEDEVPWHNDYSYSTGDYWGTALVCEENEGKVETEFVDMSRLYQGLSSEQIKVLEKTKARFSPPQDLSHCFSKYQLKRIKMEGVERSLIQTDLICRLKAVYLSPSTMESPFRSTDIFNSLMDIAEKNKFSVSLKRGDVLIFDNIRYMHRRGGYKGVRKLYRIQFNYNKILCGL